MTPLDIPIKEEYFPAIRVSVVAMYGNNVSEEASREFQVEDDSRILRVDLESRDEIKPASKTQLKIKVSDDQKRGVKAMLSYTPWMKATFPCFTTGRLTRMSFFLISTCLACLEEIQSKPIIQ